MVFLETHKKTATLNGLQIYITHYILSVSSGNVAFAQTEMCLNALLLGAEYKSSYSHHYREQHHRQPPSYQASNLHADLCRNIN